MYTAYPGLCTYGALFLSHCSITYNVSLPFHDKVFYAVVAAKRFMPLSSVVHALISLSGSKDVGWRKCIIVKWLCIVNIQELLN